MYERIVGINRRLLVVAVVAFILSNLVTAYLFVDNQLSTRQMTRDRAALTESRYQASHRGCVRDQNTAKALRNILARAQDNIRRDGRLTVKVALFYRDAIDSIQVPTCTRRSLGFLP